MLSRMCGSPLMQWNKKKLNFITEFTVFFFSELSQCLTILSLHLTYLIIFLIIMSLHLAVRFFKRHKQMLQSSIYFFMFSSVAEIGFQETDWSIHKQKNKILTAENLIAVCNKRTKDVNMWPRQILSTFFYHDTLLLGKKIIMKVKVKKKSESEITST